MALEVFMLQSNVFDKDLIFLCPSVSIAAAALFCKYSYYKQTVLL